MQPWVDWILLNTEHISLQPEGNMESGMVPSNVSLTLWAGRQQGYTLQLGSFAYWDMQIWLRPNVPRNSTADEP